jgi:hypothetical protein
MTLQIRLKALFVLAAVLVPFGALPSAAQQNHSLSVGVNYTYLRTNLLPDCNCFGLNGGGAELQYRFRPRLALLADLTATHRGDITSNHYDLTQVTYAGGLRYFPPGPSKHLRLFADVLLGAAHASGTLSPEKTGFGGANAFSFQTGGGLSVSIAHRWTLVPARAAYLLTTFSNSANDHQNDLRISSGVRLRLGSR